MTGRHADVIQAGYIASEIAHRMVVPGGEVRGESEGEEGGRKREEKGRESEGVVTRQMSGKVLCKGMDGPVCVCMNLTGCCAVPETIITVHELSDSTNCTYSQ